MAIWLYRQVRGAIREHQAKKAVSTTENSHLIPEIGYLNGKHTRQDTENDIQLGSYRASGGPIENSKSDTEKEEARQKNLQQWKLLVGLMIPNFLAAVDVTIVAPAIPLISSDFSSLPVLTPH